METLLESLCPVPARRAGARPEGAAIVSSGHSRLGDRPRAARWAVKALFFINGALFATWASRIPAVQSERGLNNGALGLALLAIAAGAVTAMPLAGLLIARMGSARLCKISALLYCATLPLILVVPGIVPFVLTLFCFGASHGALDVAMNAQAVTVEKSYGEPIMSSFHALWSSGGLVGAATGGLLAAQGLTPLAHIGLVAASLGVGALLVLPHLLETAEPRSGCSAQELPKPKFSLPARGILALGAVALCVMMGEGAMADWSAVYLRNSVGTKESLAALGYGTFSIAMAGGRFLGDYLTARFGPVSLVRAGGSLAAGGLLLALAVGRPVAALIGFALVGAGFATVVPLVFSAAGNRNDVDPGVGLASVSTVGYLGFLIGPPAIGLVAQVLGLRSALGIIVATSLIAAALASAVARRRATGRITLSNPVDPVNPFQHATFPNHLQSDQRGRAGADAQRTAVANSWRVPRAAAADHADGAG